MVGWQGITFHGASPSMGAGGAGPQGAGAAAGNAPMAGAVGKVLPGLEPHCGPFPSHEIGDLILRFPQTFGGLGKNRALS